MRPFDVFIGSRMRHWHRAGFTKLGLPLEPRQKPKSRLTVAEARIHSIFVEQKITSQDKALTMRQVLHLCSEIWPELKLTTSTTSANLATLKDNFFLTGTRATPVMVDKLTEAYKHKKQPLFWLSELAQLGMITHDENQFIIFKGEYIAAERIRNRVLAKEARKRNIEKHGDSSAAVA